MTFVPGKIDNLAIIRSCHFIFVAWPSWGRHGVLSSINFKWEDREKRKASWATTLVSFNRYSVKENFWTETVKQISTLSLKKLWPSPPVNERWSQVIPLKIPRLSHSLEFWNFKPGSGFWNCSRSFFHYIAATISFLTSSRFKWVLFSSILPVFHC